MDAFLWMFLPVFVAIGSALLAFYIMQARMEVALAKERSLLLEAQAVLNSQKEMYEEKLRATEEATQRKALDTFLADVRVEERHYMRESKSQFHNKKSMVLQERLYFRNIPLSTWVEHEMTVEDEGDIKKLAEAHSYFSVPSLEEGNSRNGARLLPQ